MHNARTIVESTLVPHTAFERASARIEQCFDYADRAAEPICIAVIGDSRTGKSRILEECCTAHPQVRQPEGLSIPILRVKTPSKPTVKGLAELMLQSMNDPRFHAGTENAKTIRLRTLMRNAGTRMVMIDEFQHFYDKGSRRVMYHVADWLKILVDDSKVALVVAGLPDCRVVLEQNEQLAGRFLSPVVMPRFDWKIDDHREEFIGILAAFQESLGRCFDMPKLDSADMAFRCYCGTGGLIGYLTKFLRQAVWNALDASGRTISLGDLANAHDQAVWARNGVAQLPSPFSRSFVPLPSEELLAKIVQMGLAAPESIPPKTRTVPLRRAEHVRDVLTAS
jgi:hypothetical protein